MSSWLEKELSRQLAGARAPEGLWERLQQPPTVASAGVSAWSRGLVAATLTVAALAGTFWLPGGRHEEGRYHTAFRVRHAAGYDRIPANWPLRCTLPPGDATYQVAAYSARGFESNPFASNEVPQDTVNCNQCHATIRD